MSEGLGLGFGRQHLVEEIVKTHWDSKNPRAKRFTFNEMLFVIQEMLQEEGKQYFEARTSKRGHAIFRAFVQHLLYRNIANYDSMLLLTSEKGCITGDALLEMPRDLKKYPKGIPLVELDGKGPQQVYSFNVKTKKLELKKCDGVEFVKIADVYELELSNGKTIKTTDDHPFLLMDGIYKQLKDIVYKNKKGTVVPWFIEKQKRVKTDRLRIFSRPHILDLNDNRIKTDFTDIKRKLGDTPLKHSSIEHRFIFEQLGYDIKGKVVHHENEKTWDNNIFNLKLLENQPEHYKKHNMEKYQFKKNNIFCKSTGYSTCKKEKIKIKTDEFIEQCREKRINFCKENLERISNISKEREKNNVNSNHIKYGVRVLSVKYLGKLPVFDVANVKDNHNFIVNGCIVSNTGKSSAAIMLARYWCLMLGIKFNPKRHIAYSNADVMNKIDSLRNFEPLICDEAIRFASAADWAKKENKLLKKKLAQVRTKHLLYILCFPLKINKLEKTYLESFTNYWIDLFDRGKGAIYVKDKNPSNDSWRIKDFKSVGSYTEFTSVAQVEKKLKKHPNFWSIIKFPKPPKWLYSQYLNVRETNVYDDDGLLKNVSKEDIHYALLVLALRDIMLHDTTLSMNRIVLHISNEYDIRIGKGIIQSTINDAKQLIQKVREKAIDF